MGPNQCFAIVWQLRGQHPLNILVHRGIVLVFGRISQPNQDTQAIRFERQDRMTLIEQ